MITFAMISALAMPPQQFDHAPQEAYSIIEFASVDLLRAACRQSQDEEVLLLGCTSVERRVIKLRGDLSPKARARVLRHEFGHLNGWKHKQQGGAKRHE